jgi:hypothetical protein
VQDKQRILTGKWVCLGYLRAENVFSAICGVDRGSCLSALGNGALILAVAFNRLAPGGGAVQKKQSKQAPRKVSCEECYFRCNHLCALSLPEPCVTFRPNDAQLKPPQQLRFVFRQERRSRAAWAFPSAQEQAALHA